MTAFLRTDTGSVWQAMLPDQPYKYALPFFHAHIHILADRCIKHAYRHIPPTAFLLQVVETLQNDTFPLAETASYIRESVIKGTVVHDGSTLITENGQCVVLTYCLTTPSC